MWPIRPHHLILVCVLLAIHSGKADNHSTKSELKFTQQSYAKELTEYHRVNVSVLHVRARGCKGKVFYSIETQNVPFSIDSRGHINLLRPFDIDKTSKYNLVVKAFTTTEKCEAKAKVYFRIINMNKHNPTFESDEYMCFITENTRSVHVIPKIRVNDLDHGAAGKIRKISIVESGLPFDFRFDQKDKKEAVMVATKDMDAEKVSGFMFDIVVEDDGEPSRKSLPVHVNCQVVDVNEFAPKFVKNQYTATIHHEKAYDNILMVEASDKDIGDEYGRICKYTITTPNQPFSIDNSGVVSLSKPLGPEAHDQYVFAVSAVDCGGKVSPQQANVTINVARDCHKGYSGPLMTRLFVMSCDSTMPVMPDVRMNDCAMKAGKANFSATVQLDTPVGRGCDRNRYEASGRYRICGAEGFIDLLPKPWKGQEWTKKLKTVKNSDGKKDDTAFNFDGKTTKVEVPNHILPEDLGVEYTISTWLKTKLTKKKQVIVASTDDRRLNRIHFALLTRNNHLEFKHRREPKHANRDEYCKSDFHYYNTPIFDNKWHHVTVVVKGCEVRMFIDGLFYLPHKTLSNWPLHKSQLKTRLVIGAVWHAKGQKYTDYFRGQLSGLTIRPKKATPLQIIECFIACKEHIYVDGTWTKGFKVLNNGFSTLRITGRGKPEDFHKLLRKITYKNKCLIPTPGQRTIRVVSKSGDWPLPTFAISLYVKPAITPKITIKGCTDLTPSFNRIKHFGVSLCRKFKIGKQGCGKKFYLDSVEVSVKPALKKGESLMFPKSEGHGTVLDDYEMKIYNSSNGFVIRGVADAVAYEQVLQKIVYVNLLPNNKLHRQFLIKACDMNGRFESNKLQVNLEVSRSNSHIKEKPAHGEIKAVKKSLQVDALPGAVVLESSFAGSTSGSISAGVMAAIVICSASLFVALVAIGIYKLKKSSSTLEVEPPNSKEELYWDDTGLAGVCVTVNPMEKFQELDLNEDGANATDNSESEDEDVDNKGAKEQLEWDDM